MLWNITQCTYNTGFFFNKSTKNHNKVPTKDVFSREEWFRINNCVLVGSISLLQKWGPCVVCLHFADESTPLWSPNIFDSSTKFHSNKYEYFHLRRTIKSDSMTILVLFWSIWLLQKWGPCVLVCLYFANDSPQRPNSLQSLTVLQNFSSSPRAVKVKSQQIFITNLVFDSFLLPLLEMLF